MDSTRPNNNDNNDSLVQNVPPQREVQSVYTESTSTKIFRETGNVVATVEMFAGLIATIKSLFGKR